MPKSCPNCTRNATNIALKDKPADMVTGMHLCRGNFRSTFQGAGGYDAIADILFNKTNIDVYFMEYDTERAGGFEPLRLVPKGKKVVLGLVTSKTGKLESKDEIKRRVEAATKYIDIDQLCLSPQCGFASTEEGNLLTEDEQWAKLAFRRRGRQGNLGTRLTRSCRVTPMQANTDRIQTTHVGSLVRPPELVDYMRKRLEREADRRCGLRAISHRRGGGCGRPAGSYRPRLSSTTVSIRRAPGIATSPSALSGLEYRAVPSERPKPTPSAGLDFERFRDFYAEYQSGQQANAGARLLGRDRPDQISRPSAGAA